MRRDTLLLDPETWDLTVDAFGNIAMASPPYALAQDVASAVKLFQGELWFDTTKGIPYFRDILGLRPPVQLLKRYIEEAAFTVEGVIKAKCVITSTANRFVRGDIRFVDETGVNSNIKL
jgi:hypothetical protein